MKVLVAYATRHGATRGIAEWIAAALEREGLEVTLAPVIEARAVAGHDAFVIGSAAYAGHWLGDASSFVRRHADVLGNRPVWLFSSGPVGNDRVDAKGRDVIEASRPFEFAEFADALRPRDGAVFFGAMDRDAKPIGIMERLGAPFMRIPAVRNAMPYGDYRDRPAVEAWAAGIAGELRRREATLPPATSA